MVVIKASLKLNLQEFYRTTAIIKDLIIENIMIKYITNTQLQIEEKNLH